MFSGLILGTAPVLELKKKDQGLRLSIRNSFDFISHCSLGASIAINGVCLTLVAKDQEKAEFDVSEETLRCSNLGRLSQGDLVHVEPSLRLGDEIGGHLVSGHVDGLAKLVSSLRSGDYLALKVLIPQSLNQQVSAFMIPKGSVALDGVSLTVNSVRDIIEGTEIELLLIPHTIEKTRFLKLVVGDVLNIEADMMAKYAQRYWQVNRSLENFK